MSFILFLNHSFRLGLYRSMRLVSTLIFCACIVLPRRPSLGVYTSMIPLWILYRSCTIVEGGPGRAPFGQRFCSVHGLMGEQPSQSGWKGKYRRWERTNGLSCKSRSEQHAKRIKLQCKSIHMSTLRPCFSTLLTSCGKIISGNMDAQPSPADCLAGFCKALSSDHRHETYRVLHVEQWFQPW